MALSSLWVDDSLPQLPTIPNFRAEFSPNFQLLSHITNLPIAEISGRVKAEHRPYIAFLADKPVAYGWVAYKAAFIGELKLKFTIPTTNRYLWDFKTLPAWRGRGLYPHLLQAIILSEIEHKAEKFWIIYAPENAASSRGIIKSGFQKTGELLFTAPTQVGLFSATMNHRVEAGAKMLGVAVLDKAVKPLASCWRCIISFQKCTCGTTTSTTAYECAKI